MGGDSVPAYQFAYVRVSTRDQNPERQIAEMRELGIPDENIFVDYATGKNYERPEYKRLLSLLRSGDTVFVSSLDRLGRNYRENVEQWKLLTKDKGVHIKVLDMPIPEGSGAMGEVINDMVILLLSYVADREYQSIRERQRAGIEAAKLRGVYNGRPPKKINTDKFLRLYAEIRADRRSVSSVCREMGIGRHLYYQLIKEYENHEGRFAEE